MRRQLDYAHARCANPALVKDEPLLEATPVNDCAVLFGARYGAGGSELEQR